MCCVSVYATVVGWTTTGSHVTLLGSVSTSEMLHLKRDYSAYHYLNHSGCVHALTIDDRKEFAATLVGKRGEGGGRETVERREDGREERGGERARDGGRREGDSGEERR